MAEKQRRKKHTIGLTDDERDRISHAARLVGRTRARFIREAALAAAGFAVSPRSLAATAAPMGAGPMGLQRWRNGEWRRLLDTFSREEGHDG